MVQFITDLFKTKSQTEWALFASLNVTFRKLVKTIKTKSQNLLNKFIAAILKTEKRTNLGILSLIKDRVATPANGLMENIMGKVNLNVKFKTQTQTLQNRMKPQKLRLIQECGNLEK